MYENIISFCEENKLMIKDNYSFNRYWDWLTSVTELLWLLEDSTFEFIKKNYKEELEKACERWTTVHSNIETNTFNREEYIKNNLEINKKDISRYYLRYKEWQLINGIKILHKEKTFVNGQIRGTIDVITNLWVVDYKTSLIDNPKYHIQVAWYCWLSWEKNWYILYLSEKKYKFVKVDLEKYTPIFLELLDLSNKLLAININKNE